MASGDTQTMGKSMVKASRQGIGPNSSDSWVEEFDVPQLPVSGLPGCSMIDVQYSILVAVNIRSTPVDLKVELPITIGTDPARHSPAEHRKAPPPDYNTLFHQQEIQANQKQEQCLEMTPVSNVTSQKELMFDHNTGVSSVVNHKIALEEVTLNSNGCVTDRINGHDQDVSHVNASKGEYMIRFDSGQHRRVTVDSDTSNTTNHDNKITTNSPQGPVSHHYECHEMSVDAGVGSNVHVHQQSFSYNQESTPKNIPQQFEENDDLCKLNY